MEANLDDFSLPLSSFLYRDPAGHRADPSPIPLRRGIVRLTNDRVFALIAGRMAGWYPIFWHTHVLLVGIPTTTFVHSVLFSFSLTLSRARGSGAASLLPGPNLYLRRNYAFHFH